MDLAVLLPFPHLQIVKHTLKNFYKLLSCKHESVNFQAERREQVNEHGF